MRGEGGLDCCEGKGLNKRIEMEISFGERRVGEKRHAQGQGTQDTVNTYRAVGEKG